MSSSHAHAPLAGLRQGSLLVVLGMAIAFAALIGTSDSSDASTRTHASRRGEEGILLIDGNRGGKVVTFDHDAHTEAVDGTCSMCHHMNMPGDMATSCFECHRDTHAATDIFDHQFHVDKHGGNSGCASCHADPNKPKTRAHVPACLSCHEDMVEEETDLEQPDEDSLFHAPGYFDAMHGICQTCHEDEMEECKFCHPAGGE